MGGNRVLEEVASCRHETLGFVLRVWDPRGPPCACVFSAEGKRRKLPRGFSEHSLVILRIGDHDKLCGRVFPRNEYQLIDEAEYLH